MSASELIAAVQAAGGSLEIQDGRIRYSLPKSASHLVGALREAKSELLWALQARSTPLCDEPLLMQEVFDMWRAGSCVVDGRGASSVSSLHIDFSKWCAGRHVNPCSRSAFERLLMAVPARMEDGFAIGLVFREDHESVFRASAAEDPAGRCQSN